jgi:formiminotetrahydrofolate cyclodeaminase
MSLPDSTLTQLLEALGEKTPIPGGGTLASTTLALSASLARMVLAYSIDKKSLAEFQAGNENALQQLRACERTALDLADADATAYSHLNELMKLPADDEKRLAEWEQALEGAMNPPQETIDACEAMLALLASLVKTTNRLLASDLAIAAVLAGAAARAAAWNVKANLSQLADQEHAEHLRDEVDARTLNLDGLVRSIEDGCSG